MRRIAVLMTCHNRRRKTLACLDVLMAQSSDGSEVTVVMVDDGSTDETAAAVRSRFPSVRILQGDGSLYWAGGMAQAEAYALRSSPDFLLWLNDDVILDPSALEILLAAATRRAGSIVVGALRDPDTLETTYSGVLRSRWHPLRFRLVFVDGEIAPADTFNGNVALIPRDVYEVVGPIDGVFAHGQADLDYGLRARKLGVEVVVAPSTIGTCARNSADGTWRDASLPLRRRYQLILDRKGLPPRSQARYLRRHGGVLWPVFFTVPYARLPWSGVAAGVRCRIRNLATRDRSNRDQANHRAQDAPRDRSPHP